MLKLDLYNATRKKIPNRLFLKLAPVAEKRLIKDKKIHRGEKFSFELSLVGFAKIIFLNKKFRKKNCETDVLSFSFFDEEMRESFIGEIFICLPVAEKQARKLGHSLHDELKFLFIHGLLHLFGYDHKKPREAAYMEFLTQQIIEFGRGAGI